MPMDPLVLNPGQPTYVVRRLGTIVTVGLALSVASLVGRQAVAPDDAVVRYVTDAVELATMLVAVAWMYRAYRNQNAFPGGRLPFGYSWLAGGWVIPIAHLFVPYLIIARIARVSLGRRRTPPVVVIWWAAWLLFIHASFLPPSWGVELALVCGAVAGFCFGLIVRRVSITQEERIAEALVVVQPSPGLRLIGEIEPA